MVYVYKRKSDFGEHLDHVIFKSHYPEWNCARTSFVQTQLKDHIFYNYNGKTSCTRDIVQSILGKVLSRTKFPNVEQQGVNSSTLEIL